MTYKIRPISDRTRFTRKPELSPFSAPWSKTERLLLSEVAHLQGRDLVIEADVIEADIRLDGRLRANASPATPAVLVAFDSKHGPLVYATNRFLWWSDNVRAIALGLEALRKVDRYGITKSGEQYRGWAAIEAGKAPTTREQAQALIDSYGGVKPALLATHPDYGGSVDAFYAVEEARRVLSA